MKKLIILSILLIVGCEETTEVEDDTIFDVDWFLMKGTAIQKRIPSFDALGNPIDCEYVYDNGYYFIYSESSKITNINLEFEVNENGVCGNETLIFNDNTQTLSFTYNGENFNFDLSDSFDSESEIFFIETNNPSDSMFPLKRILYNQNMNYIKLFSHNGLAFIDIDCSSPNEIIDYR